MHLHHLAGVGADLWLCEWQDGACEADKTGCPISAEHPLPLRAGGGTAPPAPPHALGEGAALAVAGDVVELPLEWAFAELLLSVVTFLLCLRCACKGAGPKRKSLAQLRAAQEDADAEEEEEEEGDEDFDEEDEYEYDHEEESDAYESDRHARRGRNGHGHRRGSSRGGRHRRDREVEAPRDHDEED